MTLPRIDAVDIGPHILEKIETKHGVGWREVEEVCYGRRQAQRSGRGDTLLVYGQTVAGRYLLIALAAHDLAWMVVTARDMNGAERRWYRETRRQA